MGKSSSDQILMLLKSRGEATALNLSGELGISKEGVRKHLLKMTELGLVEPTVKTEGVGRPTTYYALTKKGLSRFPDTHAEITVQLIQSVKKLLGENALNLLISDREANIYTRYQNELNGKDDLEQKLEALSKKRSEEGYMAEWKKEDDVYYLIENHCPICAAATECQGFCRSELKNFKQLVGSEYNLERVEYIVEKGNRCVYKIEKAE